MDHQSEIAKLKDAFLKRRKKIGVQGFISTVAMFAVARILALEEMETFADLAFIFTGIIFNATLVSRFVLTRFCAHAIYTLNLQEFYRSLLERHHFDPADMKGMPQPPE